MSIRADHSQTSLASPPTTAFWEWRCRRCRKLLGVLRDHRLHVSFSRGHEYLAGLPVTCTCRGCSTLNELTDTMTLSDKAVQPS
jgi:hypothetical protein